MSDPRLSSPSSLRLVAAAAAAVGALGVVALGVQLGTSGLVGDGPGRNPGSASATPASASVELPRSRPGTTLEQTLVSLIPAAGATAFGSSTGTAASAPAPAPTPTADAAPAPQPPPSDTPSSPVPTLPAPTPTIPAPTPTVPPAIEPVVEAVDDTVADVTGTVEGTGVLSPAPQSANTNTDPVGSLLQVLLGG